VGRGFVPRAAAAALRSRLGRDGAVLVRSRPADDLFLWPVDGAAVRFVRPADTDRPSWGAYDAETYLGTVHAQHDAVKGTWPVWHVQTLDERHPAIEDAVRAIRRPPSWTREREQARRWAVDLPYRRADPSPASAARGLR
jgi:hypothetical protein